MPYRRTPERDAAIFYRNVRFTETCWEWTLKPTPRGYGTARWDGRPKAAHHVSLLMCGIEISEGMDVCHHCDNRICVRPDHLYVGTRKQNMADCTARGRHNKPRGSAHWCAVLTDDQRVAAKLRHLNGETFASIAREMGVHESTISRTVRGVYTRPLSRSAA